MLVKRQEKKIKIRVISTFLWKQQNFQKISSGVKSKAHSIQCFVSNSVWQNMSGTGQTQRVTTQNVIQSFYNLQLRDFLRQGLMFHRLIWFAYCAEAQLLFEGCKNLSMSIHPVTRSPTTNHFQSHFLLTWVWHLLSLRKNKIAISPYLSFPCCSCFYESLPCHLFKFSFYTEKS